ncbi:MATE family efflux transporter [Gilvimarinus xylanilyticus]|uniref:MATE family efflux transporter n=1 Tax=Gilvimarinus xylanilyticus TaxID=2944139 RepID=A0A9X2HY33_9GAMM|nr:MATE family efflux transporter [Gilvimarinus xylanilyticus]MCP8900558.1 MATE family efflux transporter [Gilvimarinus xylanilyticus]
MNKRLTAPGITRWRHYHRGIWPLVWPILLSNLSVPLLGAVDTAILGHLPQARFLGAVAVGSSIITMVFWSLGFLRMGTTSLVSRAVGAENQDEALALWLRSAVLALCLATMLIALGQWLVPFAIELMAPASDIAPLATSYSHIRLLSAPATLLNYTLIGWFIGQQDTRRPLLILVFTNGVNIVLDMVFIWGLGLNSDGAAWASVSAEYAALLLGLWLLARKLYQLPSGRRSLTDQLTRLRHFADYLPLLTVNRHLFVRTACLLGVFTFFTAQGARAGTHVVAANAILLQLLMLTSHALDGFAHAAEALCGKATGQRNWAEFRRVCGATTSMALATALGISLIFALGEPLWLDAFTAIAPVLAEASRQFGWLIALPLLTIWAYQLDGIFLGAGLTRAMQYTMLGCMLGVFFPLWFITQGLGNTGLWLAFSTFNGARSLAMGWVFWRYLQRKLG